jgi:hypothetical protein
MGWFGFNAGSALTSGSDAVHALFNTHIAACASTVAFTIAHKLIYKKHISAVAMLNGAVCSPVLHWQSPFAQHVTTRADCRHGGSNSRGRLHHPRLRAGFRAHFGLSCMLRSLGNQIEVQRRRCSGRVVSPWLHWHHRIALHRILLIERFVCDIMWMRVCHISDVVLRAHVLSDHLLCRFFVSARILS